MTVKFIYEHIKTLCLKIPSCPLFHSRTVTKNCTSFKMEHHIFALPVRPWLYTYFIVRWIGRRGPNEWPSQSPILPSCDFVLWAWAK